MADLHSALRLLLVGTDSTLPPLRHAIAAFESGGTIVGEWLIDSERDLLQYIGDTRANQVLASLPLTMDQQISEIATRLERHRIAWRFMPTFADQLAGRISPRGLAMDNFDAAQLIDRTPTPLDEAAIQQCLENRIVLITGAGGSIGSELARCVCRARPRKLILVDRSENALFEIDRQIARTFEQVDLVAQLHDVTQVAATRDMVARYQPHVIFHAAAHKHVPMMEDHPAAAVENNLLGTRSIAEAADASRCQRFVMISTDKAVNPSSVMGATKRLAELSIQQLNQHSNTIFSMVRFGNVLGSACSVLPIWTDQIRRGGPITVTHTDMTRYFMTIPEAAGLVLQAATFSKGGEVFLLDMGEPIRILDLAERFVRLHGFEPNVNMPIHITGIRSGEKLFEQLAYSGEDMLPTPHQSIRIWQTTPPDVNVMRQTLDTFLRLRNSQGDPAHPWQGASRDAIINALRTAVPEMLRAAAG